MFVQLQLHFSDLIPKIINKILVNPIKKDTGKIVYRNEVVSFQRCEDGWSDRSVNEKAQMDQGQKPRISISTGVEKTFDKVQQASMITALKKPGTKQTYFRKIVAIYDCRSCVGFCAHRYKATWEEMELIAW